jgi:hypothetical protein
MIPNKAKRNRLIYFAVLSLLSNFQALYSAFLVQEILSSGLVPPQFFWYNKKGD